LDTVLVSPLLDIMVFPSWGRFYPVKGSECIASFLLLALIANIIRVVLAAEVVGLALLSNGVVFPLVGVGVGNMDHNDIVTIISQIPEYPDHLSVLIDTAQASDNDSLIVNGILAREARLGGDHKEPRTYHIVSKIWYTHLGYNRTRYAVQKMLTSYQPLLQSTSIQVFLTVLLHWPRCYEDIEWMDCHGEELALSDEVRSLGPNPNRNSIQAYQESWRALEDLYLEKAVANIGLSNFLLHDLQQLYLDSSFDMRVEPTLNQINVWNLFFDRETTEFLSKHTHILFQVYGLMSILDQKENAPAAYEYLLSVAENYGLQVHQVISVWFLQMKISIVPRTQNEEHLLQNSLKTLLQIPPLDTQELSDIEEAIRSLLQGQDSDRFWTPPEEEWDEGIEYDAEDGTEEEQEEDNEYDEEVESEEEEEEENWAEEHASIEDELQEF